ncbi:MAG: bifunctional demethylmenaquinone methyltransferase/2-methoxy-6-polyprenyl-1,4-benzoquinol methylase UbiE [Bacteroidales bacterium]|nr:bifunctional demethylmenaquinone methyltransferase/2-methoxy-6-polyprenyl-1,4-benzoquinol methylase UbiE [Bacteroidales bacterium]
MAYNFNTIAATYDRLNRLMTLGLDRRWRKRAVRNLKGRVLDVACGTGDLCLLLAKQGCTVTGVDLSEEMLAIAKRKAPQAEYSLADAEHLPFADCVFDAVTCAFGVRNFVHLEQGLQEMLRVLKPGGTMAILEMATPDSPLIKPFYTLYTCHLIPRLGQRLAGSREAYTYLPRSIERFPKGEAFKRILQDLGVQCRQRRLTFGVCRLYTSTKPL